ncbi:MAG: HIT family protein [Candidatus Pacearchaeota archaeon]|nr:HIT family protein [Candidatus Pacearchaeota archaeon]
MECVFCKIAKKEFPCYKVYEDKNFLAFLDIRPLNKGHTLVIPKKHYRWIWDVEEIALYFKVVKKVANAIRKAFKTEWVVSLIIGEAVPHAHVWLVPRFENDGHPKGWLDINNVKKISEKEMREIADNIKKYL